MSVRIALKAKRKRGSHKSEMGRKSRPAWLETVWVGGSLRQGTAVAAGTTCCALRGALSAHSGDEAEFGKDQGGDVDGLVVSHQVSVATGGGRVSFDVEDGVFCEFGARCVFDGDGEVFGIVMN